MAFSSRAQSSLLSQADRLERSLPPVPANPPLLPPAPQPAPLDAHAVRRVAAHAVSVWLRRQGVLPADVAEESRIQKEAEEDERVLALAGGGAWSRGGGGGGGGSGAGLSA